MSKKKLLICIAFIFVLTLIISANAYAAEEPDYLCFTAGEGGATISMEKYDDSSDEIETPTVYLEWSKDKQNWEPFKIKAEGEASPTEIPLNKDDYVYFRAGGDGPNGAFAADNEIYTYFNYNGFKIDGSVSLSGNIMSLLYATGFEDEDEVPDFAFVSLFRECYIVSIEKLRLPAETLGEYCYAGMFYNCTNLSSVPENLLPATELKEGCYHQMFYCCIALKSAPKLSATTLAEYCYTNMFYYSGLTKAPELPADTLAEGCYQQMFYMCEKLITAPKLLAPKLSPYCYYSMFEGCISLTEAPDLPATTLADECYYAMFRSCDSLITAPKILPATTLASRCYQFMFHGCWDLKEAPELPARKLVPYCYRSMFEDCSSLTEAPDLPASELREGCYFMMFQSCNQLNKVTAYFTDWGTNDEFAVQPTEYWLAGVAEEGTFKCLPELEEKYSESNIPEKWEFDNTLEPLPPEIDFPWWVIPFIFGGTGSGSSSSSEPSTPVTPVVPTASYDKCTKASDCPMYVYYDLDTTKWYHDGIHFCLDNGLMNGVGSYTFDPDGTTTRPMMVTILSRMDGCDTEGGASWDEVGKAWAKTYGISDGIPEEGNITREEFATMLYRYAQKEGKGFVGSWMFLLDFKDADKVSSWANEAVHWCVMKGILQGRTGLYEGMLDPQATLTRAEASAMIQRFCEVK